MYLWKPFRETIWVDKYSYHLQKQSLLSSSFCVISNVLIIVNTLRSECTNLFTPSIPALKSAFKVSVLDYALRGVHRLRRISRMITYGEISSDLIDPQTFEWMSVLAPLKPCLKRLVNHNFRAAEKRKLELQFTWRISFALSLCLPNVWLKQF